MLKEKVITLNDNGNQLTFKVKQMAAIPRHDLLNEFAIQLCAAGVDIDLTGITGIADIVDIIKKHGLGTVGNANYQKLRPLLMRLLGCCWRVIDKSEEQVTEQSCAAYIEDIETIYRLYGEAISINFIK